MKATEIKNSYIHHWRSLRPDTKGDRGGGDLTMWMKKWINKAIERRVSGVVCMVIIIIFILRSN